MGNMRREEGVDDLSLLVGKGGRGWTCPVRRVRGARVAGPHPWVSFRPNAFGLYDSAGNAAEWSGGLLEPIVPRRTPNDRIGLDGEWRLLASRSPGRGSFADKGDGRALSSARFRYDEDVRYYANGFRVARDLD